MGREGRGWLNAVGWRPGRCFEGCTSRGGLVRWAGVVRGTHSSGLIAQGWAESRRGRGSDSPVAIASLLTRFSRQQKSRSCGFSGRVIVIVSPAYWSGWQSEFSYYYLYSVSIFILPVTPGHLGSLSLRQYGTLLFLLVPRCGLTRLLFLLCGPVTLCVCNKASTVPIFENPYFSKAYLFIHRQNRENDRKVLPQVRG